MGSIPRVNSITRWTGWSHCRLCLAFCSLLSSESGYDSIKRETRYSTYCMDDHHCTSCCAGCRGNFWSVPPLLAAFFSEVGLWAMCTLLSFFGDGKYSAHLQISVLNRDGRAPHRLLAPKPMRLLFRFVNEQDRRDTSAQNHPSCCRFLSCAYHWPGVVFLFGVRLWCSKRHARRFQQLGRVAIIAALICLRPALEPRLHTSKLC